MVFSPRWSLIKRAANSKYARLTVLVPVIGWLLIANDEVAKFIAKTTGQASIAEPSWKIYALHAGLSIFGIGIGLFYLICPFPINKHDDFSDFASSDRRTITSDQLGNYAAALDAAGQPSPTQGTTRSLVVPQTTSDAGREVWYRRNEDQILRIQFAYYELNDKKWLVAKIAILFILSVGAVLTFIPSLITVGQSFRRLYELIIG